MTEQEQCRLEEFRQKVALCSSVDISVCIFIQEVVQKPAFSDKKEKQKKRYRLKSRLTKISKNPENDWRPRQRRQKLVRTKVYHKVSVQRAIPFKP